MPLVLPVQRNYLQVCLVFFDGSVRAGSLSDNPDSWSDTGRWIFAGVAW